jgi:hypothetical protein
MDQFFDRVKKEGYDGIEIWWQIKDKQMNMG